MGARPGRETRPNHEAPDPRVGLDARATSRHRADDQADSCRNSTIAVCASTGSRTGVDPRNGRNQDQVICGTARKAGWALRQTPTALAGFARLLAHHSGTAEVDEVGLWPSGVRLVS